MEFIQSNMDEIRRSVENPNEVCHRSETNNEKSFMNELWLHTYPAHF